jgi:hypothetical protein
VRGQRGAAADDGEEEAGGAGTPRGLNSQPQQQQVDNSTELMANLFRLASL